MKPVLNLCAAVAQWIERLPPEQTSARFPASPAGRHSRSLGGYSQVPGGSCTTLGVWYRLEDDRS